MFLRKAVAVALAVAIALGVFVITPVSAAGENWTYKYTITAGCNNHESSLRMVVEGITYGTMYHYDTIVEQSGLIYMAQRYDSDHWGPTTNLTWGLFSDNDLGLETGTWPMEPSVPITITFILRDAGLNELDREVLAPFFCDYSPGCDLLAMPDTAVVGLFVADAPLYAAPGELVAPALTMAAGKTAWVLGKDASGQYYKIAWVCDYLWVPVSSMAPNPDAVWNSAPLPTNNID